MVNLLIMLGDRLKCAQEVFKKLTTHSQPELSKKCLQCSKNPTKYTFPYQKIVGNLKRTQRNIAFLKKNSVNKFNRLKMINNI